jgi:hypothetical protein
MTDVEPHAVVFRGACPACDEEAFYIVTIPKLATGEYFPQLGDCEACGHRVEMWGAPPLDVRPCLVCGGPVVCEPDYPVDVRVVCAACRRGSLN